jgi:hypothetical protein
MAKKPTSLQRAIREGMAEQARLEGIGVIGFTPLRPKLEPGSLPMPDGPRPNELEGLDANDREAVLAARSAPPPFALNDDNDIPVDAPSAKAVAAALKKYKAAQSKMRAARREMEKLKPFVRDAAFEYWLRRYVVSAERRRDWTQATLLYENYCKHAGECAGNVGDAAILKAELASDTRFGILLREAGFVSERRSRPNGNYYPLRLKQGA